MKLLEQNNQIPSALKWFDKNLQCFVTMQYHPSFDFYNHAFPAKNYPLLYPQKIVKSVFYYPYTK